MLGVAFLFCQFSSFRFKKFGRTFFYYKKDICLFTFSQIYFTRDHFL